VQRLRLHQVGPTGGRVAALLQAAWPRIEFIQGSVVSIDPDAGVVELAGGGPSCRVRPVDYAVGRGRALRCAGAPNTPTASTTWRGANAQRRLQHANGASTVSVVGAGLTGIEVASEIAALPASPCDVDLEWQRRGCSARAGALTSWSAQTLGSRSSRAPGVQPRARCGELSDGRSCRPPSDLVRWLSRLAAGSCEWAAVRCLRRCSSTAR